MVTVARVLTISLVFSWWSQQGSCEPAVTLLAVESSVWSARLCAVYNSEWGSVPSRSSPSTWYEAEVASDLLACTRQNLSEVGGAIIGLRGNCSFCEKAEFAEVGGAKLLLVVYNESDLWVEPVCGSGNHTPSIPVLLVGNSSGWDIIHTLTNHTLTLSPYSPPPTTFDPSAIVTIFIAVVTVVLGSYIANSPFKFLRYGLLVREGERYGVRDSQSREGGAKGVAMTLVSIVGFVALICVTLLLLYYFYYPMVYVVIAVYCIGATVGLFSLLSPFAALISICKNVRVPENRLPVLEYRPDIRFPLTLLLCISLTLWWLLQRHSEYGWILQDILGFAFLVHILKRLLFLPTWVVAVAMILLFFYDIFMVFITPFLTEDHQSIMVKAATGGNGGGNRGGNTVELLPIVFIVPKLLPSPLEGVCPPSLTGSLPYSLLGYGDVGVPGLLVALCLLFDISSRPTARFRPYFLASSLAYCAGLACTYLALFLMETAQPALLYLVPTTLGTVAVMAVCRKEFRVFFTGKIAGVEREVGVRGRKSVQEDPAEVETDTEWASETEKETLIDKHTTSSS